MRIKNMKAKENTLYALIEEGKVTHIFDSTQLKEWDENAILAVEIPKGKNVEIGTQYDKTTESFLNKSLQEQKIHMINRINFLFEREVSYMQGGITQSEITTYEAQKKEAQSLMENENAETPLLNELATQRNQDKKELAKKILEKNKIYTERLAKLLGYKQNLIKQVENTETENELLEIKYISPLNREVK